MSNLHNFLQSVTPVVTPKPLPKSYIDNSIWKDTTEYFTLGDLWDCYEEWGAYGVGAPITLKNDVSVVQYYAPYLSAIQIYTIKSPTTLRNLSGDHNIDEIDSEYFRDRSDSDKSSQTFNSNSSSSSIRHMEGSKERFGYLYFEFSEVSSPFWRIPLVKKVYEFSKNHPGVKTLKSIDLSPASWMAIAWYPIYHIPMKGMTKSVSTYFLTYHTISSFFQDNLNDETEEDISLKRRENGGIHLSPFGLASYKMQNDVWMNKVQAHTKFNDLQGAADSWLKQLNFIHHDFTFFTLNS